MSKTQEALKLALEALKKCDAALAKELAAWDIDPPLHHVQDASNACGPAIAALREALAEQPVIQQGWDVDDLLDKPKQPAQQQEPVAYASDVEFDDETEIIPAEQKGKLGTAGLRIPLYIDPPASKPWVELSVDEMVALVKKYRDAPVALVAATEAALREKNA